MGLGKKKRSEEDAPQQFSTDVLSIRGSLAASNKFRGVCLLLTLVALICVSATSYVLASKQKLIIGINDSGQPTLLHETNKTMALDLYCREFISRFLCFSPSSVGENIDWCRNRITPTFSQAFNAVLGDEFMSNIRKFNVIQVTSVNSVQITDLTEQGFTATVSCGRVKNDNVSQQTVEQKLDVVMIVKKGSVTDINPWGFYVEQLTEQLRAR